MSWRRYLLLILIALFLPACAMLDSHRSRSAYESFVWSRLHEKTVVSEGKNLANVRWLVLNAEYHAKRDAALGTGTEAAITSPPALLVALQMKPGSAFAKGDFKVFWNEAELTAQREVTGLLEIRSLYPFAYPFHRVFLYPLPSESVAGKLSVLTPWGKIEDEEQP